MYDYVIVTQLPSFYKVNLYNELNKNLKVLVIFLGRSSKERTEDFISTKFSFDHIFLSKCDFEKRELLVHISKLLKIFREIKYKKLLLSGWNLLEFWILSFLSPKEKNCLALESTVIESKSLGLQGLIKKIFLTRINIVFASGYLHVELLKRLNFRNEIRVTKGVGLINKPITTVKKLKYQRKYLFLGRLSEEKNIKFIISVFKNMPTHELLIVGSGPQETDLKNFANNSSNIRFLNHYNNKSLNKLFLEQNFLLLPSISEPWGLVVEEALYFGLPVIVSTNCGSQELITNNRNGYIIDPYDKESLQNLILSIDETTYSKLLNGVKETSIALKDEWQISRYTDFRK